MLKVVESCQGYCEVLKSIKTTIGSHWHFPTLKLVATGHNQLQGPLAMLQDWFYQFWSSFLKFPKKRLSGPVLLKKNCKDQTRPDFKTLSTVQLMLTQLVATCCKYAATTLTNPCQDSKITYASCCYNPWMFSDSKMAHASCCYNVWMFLDITFDLKTPLMRTL